MPLVWEFVRTAYCETVPEVVIAPTNGVWNWLNQIRPSGPPVNPLTLAPAAMPVVKADCTVNGLFAGGT
jgi:hypothetical protein